ncbi:hypothetical protein FNV43_RR24649 [Rhamnella rubrinervis]|uniref:Legume lectin domain-containing protein n=1 Tax=Rhamnella rubrinervis TaxID=2594499 RepID=A0A8K0DLX5_9ROSA|nr:hypothetical protein FNV43_RR24649 [Rhamnella rubrinervis]
MVVFATLRYGFCSSLLLLCSSLILIAKPISSSSTIQALNKTHNFEPEIALFGDAQLVDGGSYLKLTRPSVSSSGLILRREPFRFDDPNLHSPTSFSTEFTFSISPDSGDGIVLVLVPSDFGSKFSGHGSFGLSTQNRFLGVEFDTEMDGNVGDLDANHIGVDVGSFVSVAVGNVSSMNLVLNSGEKLISWIDYDASSKRLEVRLSKFGEPRPYNPIVAYGIDMLAMWRDEPVLVGISSSNGNSFQISSIYSWTFSLRNYPNRMHSLPVDPRGFSHEHGKDLAMHRRRVCPSEILGGLIFATVCGALMAFSVLFLWTVVVNRNTIFPAESSVHPVDFRYEKPSVVVGKDADGVKK